MPGSLPDLNAHLTRLMEQVMRETDSLKHDELATDIFRVLSERERVNAKSEVHNVQNRSSEGDRTEGEKCLRSAK
jgi:hypothetical protein